jgi:hypothetical protein
VGALSVNPTPGLEGIRQKAEPEAYLSMALELFDQHLGKTPEASVLDVGPVCGENISRFAARVKRLYLCDLFLRLENNQEKDLPVKDLWSHLDYPDESFAGILIWDLVDRLEAQEAGRLAGILKKLLKPGGMVVVFALGQSGITTEVYSFALENEFQVRPRRQRHLDLPRFFRQNREILALFKDFVPVKSFRYRNGFREFVFRKGKS